MRLSLFISPDYLIYEFKEKIKTMIEVVIKKEDLEKALIDLIVQEKLNSVQIKNI